MTEFCYFECKEGHLPVFTVFFLHLTYFMFLRFWDRFSCSIKRISRYLTPKCSLAFVVLSLQSSYPRMILAWHKVAKGLEISQTGSVLFHQLFFHLERLLWLMKQTETITNLTFNITCGVISDHVKLCKMFWNLMCAGLLNVIFGLRIGPVH